MLTIQEVLDNKGRELVDALIVNQSRKGQRASGYSAENTTHDVQVGESEYLLTITGPRYWEYQNRGRGPGRYDKPPRALVQAIKEWVEIKGLDIPYYAIAVKINREGTRTFREPSRGGVLTETFKPAELTKELSSVLIPALAAQITQRLFA